jgi:hypothetical protein
MTSFHLASCQMQLRRGETKAHSAHTKDSGAERSAQQADSSREQEIKAAAAAGAPGKEELTCGCRYSTHIKRHKDTPLASVPRSNSNLC